MQPPAAPQGIEAKAAVTRATAWGTAAACGAGLKGAGSAATVALSSSVPGHPSLLALLDAGAQPSEFAAFAERAKGKSAPFRWLLGALAGERKSAADMASQLHRGAMPSRAPTAAEQRVLQAVPGLAAPHLRAQAAALPAELAEVIDVTPRRLG